MGACLPPPLPTVDVICKWSLSFFDIKHGLYVNLMVFPPIILVAVLFRKSMPAKKRSNRVDNGIELVGILDLTKLSGGELIIDELLIEMLI